MLCVFDDLAVSCFDLLSSFLIHETFFCHLASEACDFELDVISVFFKNSLRLADVLVSPGNPEMFMFGKYFLHCQLMYIKIRSWIFKI